MIKVVDVVDGSEYPCHISWDWYIPISFGAYEGDSLGGTRYIFVSSTNTELLEFQVAADAMVLRAFIWVAGTAVDVPGFHVDARCKPGLPVLGLPEGERFSNQQGAVARLGCPVALCRPGRHADIRIGTADTFDRCLSHGRVRFLILGDELVGLRVVDLTDEERGGLEDYIARQAPPQSTPR